MRGFIRFANALKRRAIINCFPFRAAPAGKQPRMRGADGSLSSAPIGLALRRWLGLQFLRIAELDAITLYSHKTAYHDLRKRIVLAAVFFVFSISSASASDDPNDFGEEKSVTVLASSSMTVPLAEIAKIYSKKSNIDVNTVYEATPELLEKIKAGDPADVVITPNLKYLDEMKAEGLIAPDSIVHIASNSLSLVCAKEFKIELAKGDGLKEKLIKIRNKTLMIAGNPEGTSLGNYTRQVLQKIGLWQSFEKFIIPAPTSSKTVDLIIKSQSAGIIFSSDYQLYHERLTDLGLVPESTHQPIDYYGAVVVSDNMEKARSFLKFISGKVAKDIFKADGFVVK